jgi:hypothetical protein
MRDGTSDRRGDAAPARQGDDEVLESQVTDRSFAVDGLDEAGLLELVEERSPDDLTGSSTLGLLHRRFRGARARRIV